ncbi:MAG: peptide ABC transporter substrate-binding protein [Proteobacteria bacterium]|nr:peptide ABC transporter substrate-binding protein [Pseudomonadota bacterium]
MTGFTFRRFGGALAAGLLFAGLFGGALPASAQKVLRIANQGEPETLDPHKTSTTVESNVLRNLFEGLVVQDTKGNPAPGVAEKWSVSEDGVVYTFKLRGDAKWSNGDAVTASDFVFSLRRIQDPKLKSQYAEVLYPIKNAEEVNTGKAELSQLGAKAVDPQTLEITLKAPTPYFVQLLTHQTGLPVSEKVVTQLGDEWVKPGKMVSNGAYVLDEVKPASHIKVVKNPKYWDAGKVKIDAIVFDPMEDRSQVLKRYRAGEFDIVYGDLPNDQLEWLKQNMPKELHIAPYAGIYYYTFNTTKPPLNDVKLRTALSMAIDRQTLVDKITLAGELPAYGFIPDGTAGYASQRVLWAKMSQAEREAEAVKLMKEAGYGPDKPLKLTLNYNTSENHKKIAVAIASMWKKLGVDVDLVNTELKVHYANLRQGDFQVGRAGWIADYNDAQNYLFLAQTSTKQQNYSKFSNPDYDKLMDQASVTSEEKKRAPLMQQAEAIMLKELPVMPIYFYVAKNLVSTKVHGWTDDNSFNVQYVKNMSLD